MSFNNRTFENLKNAIRIRSESGVLKDECDTLEQGLQVAYRLIATPFCLFFKFFLKIKQYQNCKIKFKIFTRIRNSQYRSRCMAVSYGLR